MLEETLSTNYLKTLRDEFLLVVLLTKIGMGVKYNKILPTPSYIWVNFHCFKK